MPALPQKFQLFPLNNFSIPKNELNNYVSLLLLYSFSITTSIDNIIIYRDSLKILSFIKLLGLCKASILLFSL